MAKKKKKPKPKQGHPARVHGNVVDMARVKVQRGLDALTPQFVTWYTDRHGDAEFAPIILSAVGETLGVYSDVVGLDSVTDFDPPTLFAVMNSMVEFEANEDPEADAEELRGLIFVAVSEYAEFLGEAGLWKREASSLEWLVNALLADDPFDLDQEIAELNVPKAPEEAVAQIVAMPIFAIGQKLLSWSLSTGQDLFADGNNPEFIRQATGAVEDLFATGLGAQRREFTVNSSIAALEAADALNLVSTPAPSEGPAAPAFTSAEGAEAFDGIYLYLRTVLDLLVGDAEGSDQLNVEAWGLTNLWLLEAVDGEPHEVNAPRAEQFSEEVWAAANDRMEYLRTLGLVQGGDTYDIPGIVRLALTDLDQDDKVAPEAEADDPFGFAFDEAEEPKREKRTEPYRGKVLQLKLALRDVKPPIWRRVFVPADLNLADLHDIIQISFDWSDSHLHQFHGPNYKPSYGPKNSYMESDIDESTVLLSKVFKKPKDRLSYSYDFGDNWRIGIEVEDVLRSDDGQLPRCIGGRRMGPLEDSGGPWRWTEMVEELKNDQPLTMMEDVVEEDYALTPGEDFDPAVFSIEEINENLDLEF